jgi:hypothetical protein
MTKRRTKPPSSKTRAKTRPRSGDGQTWLIAAIVLVALAVVGAGLWLIGARSGQSATTAVSQLQPIKDLEQLPPGRAEHVEVAYFHRTHRCASCIEAERLVRKTFDTYFTDQFESGEVSLVVADFQKQQDAALAQEYDPYGPSLYLGIIKDGAKYIWQVSDIWFAMRDEPRFMALLRDKINLACEGR